MRKDKLIPSPRKKVEIRLYAKVCGLKGPCKARNKSTYKRVGSLLHCLRGVASPLELRCIAIIEWRRDFCHESFSKKVGGASRYNARKRKNQVEKRDNDVERRN